MCVCVYCGSCIVACICFSSRMIRNLASQSHNSLAYCETITTRRPCRAQSCTLGEKHTKVITSSTVQIPGKPSALFLRQKLLVLGVKLPKKIGHLAFQVGFFAWRPLSFWTLCLQLDIGGPDVGRGNLLQNLQEAVELEDVKQHFKQSDSLVGAEICGLELSKEIQDQCHQTRWLKCTLARICCFFAIKSFIQRHQEIVWGFPVPIKPNSALTEVQGISRDCNGLHAPSLSCSQTNAVRSWSSNFECSPCQVMPTAFAILSRDQLHKKTTSCHHVGWKTVESTGYRLLKAPSIVWCLVNAQCVSMFSSTYRSGAKEYTSTQSVLWNR